MPPTIAAMLSPRAAAWLWALTRAASVYIAVAVAGGVLESFRVLIEPQVAIPGALAVLTFFSGLFGEDPRAIAPIDPTTIPGVTDRKPKP